MADVLQVEKREKLGTAQTRRLRKDGKVPAVLYGHGQSNEHLAVGGDSVRLLLRHHSKTVELQGAVSETAFVSDMQWDPLGIEVLHMDLIRVNLKEMVHVTVAINVTGEAAGLREGGVLLENIHEVEIDCPAGEIPDFLQVDVKDLQIGEHRTAADLILPSNAKLLTPPETVIVHVEMPREESEEEASADDSEPEVIAKGGEKEEED